MKRPPMVRRAASAGLGLVWCLGFAMGVTPMNEPNEKQVYTVKKAEQRPGLDGAWNGPAWQQAAPLDIRNFHAQSSDHHPQVQARVLYDDRGLYLIFHVKDRYVLSTHTKYQDSVCEGSCVEFFVQPKPDKGYFNFEINAGGTLLLTYLEVSDRKTGANRRTTEVPWDTAKQVAIYHSLPSTVAPERTESTEWCIEYFVPFSLFEPWVGPLGTIAGQSWRANFYKCADKSSHPHWASWAPLGEQLSFHLPYYFGTLTFTQ